MKITQLSKDIKKKHATNGIKNNVKNKIYQIYPAMWKYSNQLKTTKGIEENTSNVSEVVIW